MCAGLCTCVCVQGVQPRAALQARVDQPPEHAPVCFRSPAQCRLLPHDGGAWCPQQHGGHGSRPLCDCAGVGLHGTCHSESLSDVMCRHRTDPRVRFCFVLFWLQLIPVSCCHARSDSSCAQAPTFAPHTTPAPANSAAALLHCCTLHSATPC